jgi:hypothetical protein
MNGRKKGNKVYITHNEGSLMNGRKKTNIVNCKYRIK